MIAYSQRPLNFEPGSKWAYCNAGIDTLGRVIEVASGQSYETFLKERLFDPLGMADTAFYPCPPSSSGQRSRITSRTGSWWRRTSAHRRQLRCKVPDPRRRTVFDGRRPGEALPDDARRGSLGGKRYLSEASVDTMTKVQTGDLKTGFSDGMGFGFGWGVVRQPTGVTDALSAGSFGHGGAFGTQGWIDPTKGRFAILMIQRTGLKNSDASELRAAPSAGRLRVPSRTRGRRRGRPLLDPEAGRQGRAG